MVLTGDLGISDVYVYQGCNSKGEGGEDQAQRIKKRSEIGANFLSFTNTNYIFVCREI